MNTKDTSWHVLDAAYAVHNALGPGLLESSYQECLYYKLKQKGCIVEKQKKMPLFFEEITLDVGYRVDLMVENELIVEIKAVEALNNVHMAQLLTYLKLADCHVGLLLNFNEKLLKNGIRRVVNNY